jgi:hypothetical protein
MTETQSWPGWQMTNDACQQIIVCYYINSCLRPSLLGYSRILLQNMANYGVCLSLQAPSRSLVKQRFSLSPSASSHQKKFANGEFVSIYAINVSPLSNDGLITYRREF